MSKKEFLNDAKMIMMMRLKTNEINLYKLYEHFNTMSAEERNDLISDFEKQAQIELQKEIALVNALHQQPYFL